MKNRCLLMSLLGLVSFSTSSGVCAGVYAGAEIEIRNLSIIVYPVNAPAATTWNFSILNLASLTPGGLAATTNQCSGGPGPGPCNPVVPGVTPAGDVLYAGPAQEGIALPPQSFTFLGPNSGFEYARADAVISDANLAGDPATSISNVAEVDLVTGTAASGKSDIQSSTGLDFQFSAPGPGTFIMTFEADPAIMADIDDPASVIGTSAASHSVQVKLAQDTGVGAGASFEWNPRTINAPPAPTLPFPLLFPPNGCPGGNVQIAGAGITCDVEYSSENLNNDATVSLFPQSSDSTSYPGTPGDQGLQLYYLRVQFTNAGHYTLALTSSLLVSVSRQPQAVFYDLGDNPDSYHTLLGNNGPRHLALATIYMGQCLDGEDNGQPSVGADLDDDTPSADVLGTCVNEDDEDGVINPGDLANWTNNETRDIRFAVRNTGTADANLYGWIDFDGSGEFDPGERQSVLVPAGTLPGTEVVLTFTSPADAVAVTGGSTYARFRLSTDPAAADPTGEADDGEVEDYPVTLFSRSVPLMGPWGAALLILLLPAVAAWRSRRRG